MLDVDDLVALADQRLRDDDAARERDYPGDRGLWQPVHTVYVPADRLRRTTVGDYRDHALGLLAEHDDLFREITGADDRVVALVRDKLRRQPIEDLRADFEDGYGVRPDADEDKDVREGHPGLLAPPRRGGLAGALRRPVQEPRGADPPPRHPDPRAHLGPDARARRRRRARRHAAEGDLRGAGPGAGRGPGASGEAGVVDVSGPALRDPGRDAPDHPRTGRVRAGGPDDPGGRATPVGPALRHLRLLGLPGPRGRRPEPGTPRGRPRQGGDAGRRGRHGGRALGRLHQRPAGRRRGCGSAGRRTTGW